MFRIVPALCCTAVWLQMLDLQQNPFPQAAEFSRSLILALRPHTPHPTASHVQMLLQLACIAKKHSVMYYLPNNNEDKVSSHNISTTTDNLTKIKVKHY
jgi:hypothetical protein